MNATKLTWYTFQIIVGEYGIDPDMAVESDRVREAIKAGCTPGQLRTILDEEF